MSEFRVAMFGCGTVGLQVAKRLLLWQQQGASPSGVKLVLSGVCCRTWDKEDRQDIPESIRVSRMEDLLDIDADVYVELAGGMQASQDFILDALQRGKHVVTANKLLLAQKGQELLAIAAEHGAALEFEAAVGGGIPIIQALREGLAGNEVSRIVGILNGTSNYILTRMAEDKLSYFNALKIAQDKGYAEKDPQADVGGEDAAQKLVLLCRIAFGAWNPYETVSCKGLEQVSTESMLLARVLGYQIKPLVVAQKEGGGLSMFSGPVLVDEASSLASVRLNDNAVQYETDLAGRVTVSGMGAGGKPTASAVLSDILRIACGSQAIGYRAAVSMPALPPTWQTTLFQCWKLKSLSDQIRVLEDLKKAGLQISKSTVRAHTSQHYMGVIVTGEFDREQVRELAERRGLPVPLLLPVL